LLDASCFGNLDGGPDMALHVKHRLELCGCTVKGSKAVRLALDEAFFMQHCLNNLKIYGSSSGCDTICHLADSEVWQQFRELRSDFLIQYLAYHHFRSKGWIARTGQQFGADYVLYQRHPAIAHSDYSVIIIPLTSSSDTDLRRPDLDWCDIQILNRMSVQVHKRLLLFYVKEINPGGGDKSSPNCLSNWAVHETLVRRWVAESHRSM
jgi:tRNA-splicing endonuclease subunit Sen2